MLWPEFSIKDWFIYLFIFLYVQVFFGEVGFEVIISVCFTLIICHSNGGHFLGVSALLFSFNDYSLGLKVYSITLFLLGVRIFM